ncbi:MAG: TrkA family potassium uptake protein [Bacteroidales bacterium]|nr:TrkA family potassium uptake protein [Bacteroidales bacterium]
MSNERFAIIGAGHFGYSIAIALSRSGAEVLVIDSDINVIQDLSEEVAYAVCIDATNKKALIAENIQDFDVVVVAIGNDFVKRLLCTANLMDLGVKRIVCRTMGESQRLILKKMGVEEFLSPEDEIGTLFAERLLNPSIVSYLQLPDGYRIAEIIAPQRLIGLTIADLNLRDAYRLSLITIRRNFAEQSVATQNNATGHTLGVPDTSTVIEENDCFVIFGLTRDIDNFIKRNQI